MRRRDPYMRDENIAKAAHLQIVGGIALGAGTGGGAAGWFEFPPAITIPVGALLGFLVAMVILGAYGGRSTR
jgi:hypothetical protein